MRGLVSRVVLCFLSAALAGCFQHGATPLPGPEVSRDAGGARVTLASGRSLVLYRATVRRDTLWGVTAPDRVERAIPTAQIARYERLSFNGKQSLWSVGMLLVAAVFSVDDGDEDWRQGARPSGTIPVQVR